MKDEKGAKAPVCTSALRSCVTPSTFILYKTYIINIM